MLQREPFAIAHEFDCEIARRCCDSYIWRADCERRFREHLGDAPAARDGALEHYRGIGDEGFLQFRTSRGGGAHAHHVPIVLELEARGFAGWDEERDDGGIV